MIAGRAAASSFLRAPRAWARGMHGGHRGRGTVEPGVPPAAAHDGPCRHAPPHLKLAASSAAASPRSRGSSSSRVALMARGGRAVPPVAVGRRERKGPEQARRCFRARLPAQGTGLSGRKRLALRVCLGEGLEGEAATAGCTASSWSLPRRLNWPPQVLLCSGKRNRGESYSGWRPAVLSLPLARSLGSSEAPPTRTH